MLTRDARTTTAVGRRLADTRRALGLTQEELSDFLGISRGALGNYEQGQRLPDAAVMIRFADRYGVPMDWIYRGETAQLSTELAGKLRPFRAELRGRLDDTAT